MRNSTLTLLLLASTVTACEKAPLSGTSECGLTNLEIGVFVKIEGGEYIKSADPLYPEEGTPTPAQSGTFLIQVNEVTNRQFSRFVEATGYITDAEKSLNSDNPAAGSALFTMPENMQNERPWRLVNGATWRNPDGNPASEQEAIENNATLPVVHVSHRDALAYANWAGGRLPTETEWEFAAATGLADPDDQRSGAYDKNEIPVANTWQGIFPLLDRAEDGFRGPAPVGCYAPSKLGLYDMIGNVWEWTSTPYSAGNYTIKGGSFLCSDDFCGRYRPAARQPQETDFSTNHIGFRVVKDL